MSTLADEVAKFREWAQDHGLDNTSMGEWECDYPDWQALYAATDEFFAATGMRSLTDVELDCLLYTLARDNEDERILERLEQFPSIAMQVVQAAVSSPDADARWQAAVLAGRIGAIATVRRFLDDETEYVRRRAGFALKEMERAP